ncbi:unnamed protein product, partial [Discosporangium mesarthrocarpum]
VAYGETRDDPQLFEFFCEKNIMGLFVQALQLGDPDIQTQVIQAISILIQNICSVTSLYMLLSKDHINRLIDPNLGKWARPGQEGRELEAEGSQAAGMEGMELPWADEEFLSHYVALLKAISVRLSPDTVQFFLDAFKGSFPLYRRAVPLIGHADPMVRTCALSIVLHICSVQDKGVSSFLALPVNCIPFFTQISGLLQEQYSLLLCRV